jgi:hypothetical protein
VNGKFKSRQCTQDGKKQRKPKEEIQQEMLRLKEGLETDDEVQKKAFLADLKNQVLKELSPEEKERERLEQEALRKRFLESIRPKSK